MTKEPLRCIADIQTGPFGSQLHKEDYVENGTPIVTVEHLGNRVFTVQNLPQVSDNDKERLKKYVLREGDIVFSRVGSVDRCSLVDKEHDGWMFSGRCLRVRPNTHIDALFLYYFFCLEGTKEFVRNIAVGATMPSINTKLLGEIEVAYPCYDMQRKVSSVLSDLDSKIELNEKINHNLEQQAQAIFKSWFVDFDPFGGVMPDDWQEIQLGDLCVTVTKGTTPTTLKKQFVEQGINFVKAESILNDHSIDFGKLAFIDDDTNALLGRSIIQVSDIIFTIAGTLGRFAFVCENLLPANTNQAVAIIRANTFKINPVTLYSFFVGGLHMDFYAKHIQQAVQANLSLTTIKALPLLLPPEETLAEYSMLVEPIFERIFHNYTENRRLAELRDTLLPKLMSGELSVTDI